MKKFIISLCTCGALTFSGCSDSYLDVAPENQVSNTGVFTTTKMLDGAVNGLSRIMSDIYSNDGFGRQGYNGEATISLWYGDYKSSDAQYSNAISYLSVVCSNHNEVATSDFTYFPWYYYYMLISNANAIILHGRDAEGTDAEKDFYIAQALVYRAHAYTQLAALYCKRWVDSRNGQSRGLPIRLNEDKGDLACSNLGEVYDQIYADLDEAIRLFGQTSLTRDKEKVWRTDVSVAHGIYSRAALAKEDWATAADHAAKARQNYNLMTASEYWDGFNTPNQEWMWETYTDVVENLGVYGFFAYIASNTKSSKGYKYVGSIDADLINSIPDSDSRKNLYMVPQPGESGWSTTNSSASKGDFYTRVKKQYSDRLYSKTTIFAYMQTKFLVIEDRSVGCTPIMRAAEMIYNEAEALCMTGGNETKVRALLEEAVRPYQPDYTCNLSGDALLEEVKLYKRFDLWGEGRHYFDQKRWNVPMVRKSWDNGGNWHTQFAASGTNGGSYDTKGKNNWCICIPNKETDYNKLINYNIEPENWTKDSPQQ